MRYRRYKSKFNFKGRRYKKRFKRSYGKKRSYSYKAPTYRVAGGWL